VIPSFTGPWVTPVTPTPAGANGRQFIPASGWVDALDGTVVEAVPFIIEGVLCGATPVENSTWGNVKGLYR
jgi:hypothetical protein